MVHNRQHDSVNPLLHGPVSYLFQHLASQRKFGLRRRLHVLSCVVLLDLKCVCRFQNLGNRFALYLYFQYYQWLERPPRSRLENCTHQKLCQPIPDLEVAKILRLSIVHHYVVFGHESRVLDLLL